MTKDTRGRDGARHRNNAAEWVMWVVLWPVAWVLRRLPRRERFDDRGQQ